MGRRFDSRWIVGKRVVRVDTKPRRIPHSEGGHGETMHDPEMFFEDGSSIVFVTQEHPDGADYGTQIVYRRPEPPKERGQP